MKARLLFDRRIAMSERAFAELVLWEVPQSVRGSAHSYKYRLAFVTNGVCVLRYDNEAGKGNHVHISGQEQPYRFTGPDRLVADFFADVRNWLNANRDT
ncbi:MAG TPA: DUF6516 family protein [Acetobacteraceae bacterium]|jgi:hypothetical protein|nr:DUF6516 family protein [Acetobacteraceae bacterium]